MESMDSNVSNVNEFAARWRISFNFWCVGSSIIPGNASSLARI